MRVLIVGSGAREHAIAWKLSTSSHVSSVFTGPGNAGVNSPCLPAVNPLAFDTVEAACAENSIDCVFVGPETPLAEGIVDHLSARGITVIGPDRHAAQLESSKVFSKAFLLRNNLPTAAALDITDMATFEAAVRARAGQTLVIKKSGLAAGKGVLESADTEEILAFGKAILATDSLLVEEYLRGWEVSVFGLSDGATHIVLPPCTDFKKAHDGDKGPNTGGMGSICPVPWVDAQLMDRIHAEVIEPTYAALQREGLDYRGVLFFGLMITATGPKILEFNVRFGDPETQVLMPMLDFDLGEALRLMVAGRLGELKTGGAGVGAPVSAAGAGTAGAALGVVVASHGYPDHPQKGLLVRSLPGARAEDGVLFHAGSVRDSDGRLLAGGGRCFTAVGRGADLAAAAVNAYALAEACMFDGAWFRRDIGKRFMAKGPGEASA